MSRGGRTVLAMDCALAGAETHRGRPLNEIVRRPMSIDLVYDNLDATGGSPILVEATIILLSKDHGGKTRPITTGYRPNHNFDGPENRNMFIGQVELKEGGFVHPGESRDVLVRFLNVQGLADRLSVGTEWRIQEGARLVGVGMVKRVVST